MTVDRQLNTTSYPLKFDLLDTAGAPVSGVTPTVQICKSGSNTFSTAAATPGTSNAQGTFELPGNATDRNTLGAIKYRISGSGAMTYTVSALVVAYDPIGDAYRGTAGTALPPSVPGVEDGLPLLNENGFVRADAIHFDGYPSQSFILEATSNALFDAGVNVDRMALLDAAISTRHSATQHTADFASILTNISNVPGLVWVSGGRTLTGFGTLGTDVATLLSRVPNGDISAFATRGLTLLELASGSVYRFTAAALANTPAAEAGDSVWNTTQRDQVIAQVNKLTSATVYVFDPVQGANVRIVKGDSYRLADGRAIDIPLPDGANWPTDLTGWTIKLTANRTPKCPDQTGVASIEIAGTVVVATGPTRKVRLQPTSAETATLSVGNGNKGYAFDVEARSGTERATLLRGLLTVDAQQTTG